MSSTQSILSEIQAISPAVANLPKTNPFSVPDQYFENNISNTISLIKGKDLNNQNEALNINLPIDENKNLFDLPKGYFESFGNELMNKIRTVDSVEDELSELAPSLISLRTKKSFSVPLGYFDSIVIKLPLKEPRLAPIFPIKQVMRYAAAACIIGLIVVSYMLLKVDTALPTIENTANIQQASELSLEDMVVYLEQMEELGHDDETAFSSGNESNLLVDLSQETIQDLLVGITDKGIMEYIEDEEITIEKNIN